jgi:DNA-binding protein HU-beta
MRYEYLIEDCVAVAKASEPKLKLTKKVAEAIIKNVFENIKEALKDGQGLSVRGFGSFKPIEKKARTYIEPRTQKPIEKGPSIYPKFTPSSRLKEELNA